MKKLILSLFLISTLFSFDLLYTKAFMAFQKGIRLEKTNPKKAQQYFEQAYLLLNEIKTQSSQKYYMLGKMYCNGWGVPQNLDKAEKYFMKALKLGNKRVYCCLAKLYIKKREYAKAKKYLNLALANPNLTIYCKDINPKTLTIK